MAIPIASIIVLVIICIFVFFQLTGPNVFQVIKVMFIPLVVFVLLLKFYKKGVIYHGIVDTLVALVLMACIKVREYVFPLFHPKDRILVPERDLPRDALVRDLLLGFPEVVQNFVQHGIESNGFAQTVVKFILCVYKSYQRTFYKEYPDMPLWFTPLSNIKILTSGILFLVLVYTFWPFLTKGIAFIFNNPGFTTSYTKYGILVAIFTVIAAMFAIRFFTMTKINYIFYDEEPKEYEWLNRFVVKIQEHTFTFMNVYEAVIVIVVAFLLTYMVARSPFIFKAPLDIAYFKLFCVALAIGFAVLVGFKSIKYIFTSSGFVKWCVKSLATKSYSVDLKHVAKSSFPPGLSVGGDGSGPFENGKDLFFGVEQYGRSDPSKQKRLQLVMSAMVGAEKVGGVEFEINRKFNQDKSLKSLQTNCIFKFEETYKKENVASMINKFMSNNELVLAAAPLKQYYSFHLLPIVLAVTFAYVFTKLHRILFPDKKYNDSDMLVETFIIFLCGFYVLVYILEADGSLSKRSKIVLTVGCSVFLLVPVYSFIKLKSKTLFE